MSKLSNTYKTKGDGMGEDLGFQLLPGESVLRVDHPRINHPRQLMPAIDALLRLVRAKSVDQIGDTGPVMASTVTEENKGVAEMRLFEAFFPRDAMYVAEILKSSFPRLLRTTLIRCAELQGIKDDPDAEEEPGRIPHEVRDPKTDPVAQRLSEENGWRWPYYGSVDNTPHFVALVCDYVRHSAEGLNFLAHEYVGRDGQRYNIFEAVVKALEWIERRRSKNSEGFVESLRAIPKGHRNQVWMDSPDSYFHADGELSNDKAGVSSIEVQALVFDAYLGISELYAGLDEYDNAEDWSKKAEEVRAAVLQCLWVTDDEGVPYFALGGDHDPETGAFRPFKIRKSNMGHLLGSRLLDGEYPQYRFMVDCIVKNIMSEDMLAASGVRTCAKKEKRFRPGAYHNGSVWLWDTFIIARGMRKHGYSNEAEELERRIIGTVYLFRKYPEYARGGEEPQPVLNERVIDLNDQINGFVNRVEQPPQEVQAWTVAAVVALQNSRVQQPVFA